ncbi:MAG: hypothetical protein JXR83_03425, partial [Deltaproteobacteria bacterium]|nr:hypothetical protein [Deltaproteobacteria bacterium]
MKAFIVNRVGDFAFVVGMAALFWGYQGTFDNPQSSGGNRAYRLSAESLQQHRSFAPGRPEYEQRVLAQVSGALPEPAVSITFRTLQAQLAEPTGGTVPDRVCEHGHCHDAERPQTRGDLLAKKRLWGVPLLVLVCILFFVGATGKSAQLPLFVWLPDAMAGPTPVSALIHAATMVTAGVYMVARLHFLYALAPPAMTVVATVGALTALFAATIGFFQHDIKKVLAYSTVSQLGFMFIGVGVGAYWAGIFHLVNHAFFKACLFLGSGSVIMGSRHNQDMRWMGGLKKHMPRTAWSYLVACMAISGFPWAAGFFSKDEILWKAFDSYNMLLPGGGLIIWGLAFVAATGTSFYMWRSYYVTFTGVDRHDQMPPDVAAALHAKHQADQGTLFFPPDMGEQSHTEDGHRPHGRGENGHGHGAGAPAWVPRESPLNVTLVLAILGIASLVLGIALGFPALWAHTLHLPIPNLFEDWVHHSTASSAALIDSAGHGVGIEWLLAGGSVLVATIGWAGARALYRNRGLPLADEKLAQFDVASTLRALARPRQPIPSEGAWAILDAIENAVAVPMRWLARGLLAVGGLFGEGFNRLVRGGWRLVADKYRVDELYHFLVVKRVLQLTRLAGCCDRCVVDGAVNLVGWIGRIAGFISGAIDKIFVDGAVNGVAAVTLAVGGRLRRLQGGRIQGYLLGAVGG